MKKSITVHVVTSGSTAVPFLTKGEAEKAKAVLEQFGHAAEITQEKRTATIA